MYTDFMFKGKALEDYGDELYGDFAIKAGEEIIGNLIWNNGNPFIVGSVAEATEEYIALEYWIPVHKDSVSLV